MTSCSSFLVKLKLCDDLIASGEVVSSEGKQVHGVRLGLDEVVVQLDKVDGDDIQHPIHLYPLEKGSFTAWKRNDLVVIG